MVHAGGEFVSRGVAEVEDDAVVHQTEDGGAQPEEAVEICIDDMLVVAVLVVQIAVEQLVQRHILDKILGSAFGGDLLQHRQDIALQRVEVPFRTVHLGKIDRIGCRRITGPEQQSADTQISVVFAHQLCHRELQSVDHAVGVDPDLSELAGTEQHAGRFVGDLGGAQLQIHCFKQLRLLRPKAFFGELCNTVIGDGLKAQHRNVLLLFFGALQGAADKPVHRIAEIGCEEVAAVCKKDVFSRCMSYGVGKGAHRTRLDALDEAQVELRERSAVKFDTVGIEYDNLRREAGGAAVETVQRAVQVVARMIIG